MNLSTLTLNQWIDIGVSVLVFAVTALLGHWLIKLVFQRLIRRLTGFTKTTLDNAILDAIAPPLYWLALVYAFRFSLNRLTSILEGISLDFEELYFVLFLLIWFAVAWRLVAKLALWYENRFTTESRMELGRQLTPFLRRVTLIILSVIVAIILLGHFNIEVSGFVATLGIGSLAIALAAQATLADTISEFFFSAEQVERESLDGFSDFELIEYCRERMASYKKPERIFFAESLPRNAAGKLVTKDLRKKYA